MLDHVLKSIVIVNKENEQPNDHQMATRTDELVPDSIDHKAIATERSTRDKPKLRGCDPSSPP